MHTALLLVALVVANMGGVGDVLGVSPGYVAGSIVYPNKTGVAVFVNTTGMYMLMGGVGVLDANKEAILAVMRNDRLVAIYGGRAYILGFYTKSMPPYTVMPNGLVGTVFGLLYPNGTLVEYRRGGTPLTPVATAWGDALVLVSHSLSTILLYPGRRAYEYHGLMFLCYSGRFLAGFNTRGHLVILWPNNTLWELRLENASPTWGKTLDTSTISCYNDLVALTVNVSREEGVAILNVTSVVCRVLRLGDVKVLGVALDRGEVTLGYTALKPIKPRIERCRFVVEQSLVAPSKVEVHVAVKHLRPYRITLEKVEPRVSLIARNIILEVYRFTSNSSAEMYTPVASAGEPHRHNMLLAAGVAAMIIAALIALAWRFGGVRSPSSHRG